MKKLLLSAACLLAVGSLFAATLKKDLATYDVGANYTFENVWIQSRNAENFPAIGGYSATDMSRGMAVIGGKILITKRIPPAIATDFTICQVLVYDGATGDLLKTIALPDTMFTVKGVDGAVSQTGLPANDIQIDNAGNILIANYTSNLYTSPYQIYKIDIDFTAGTVTAAKRILSYKEPFTGEKAPGTMRIDYFNVFGDVMGNGYLMGSVGGVDVNYGNSVIKWGIVNGVTDNYMDQIIIKEYVSDFAAVGNSSGSRVTPLSETLFYLDGQDSYATLYDMDGNYVDGFKNILTTDFVKNMTIGNNGVDEFMLGGKNFMVFSYRNTTGSPASSWAIAEMDPTGAAPINPLTAFPAAGMGSISNGVRTALPRIEVIGDVAYIYVYGCNNGLAAYKFSKKIPNAIDEQQASNVTILLKDNKIEISEEVASAEVYSVTGQKMASVINVSSISAPVAKGVYIVTIIDKTGAKKVQKVAVN